MGRENNLDVLDHAECLALLTTVPVGRLLFVEDAMPMAHPVNFRIYRGDVVLRVAGGGKLAAAVAGQVVGFQADCIDPELCSGWSVTVVGRAERITDITALVDVGGTWLRSWVSEPRGHFLRVRAQRVTGRRLRAIASAGHGGR